MSTTWVVVAHRGGARIFESHGPAGAFSLVEERNHPEGTLKAKDINSDEPGRTFQSAGVGRSAVSPHEDPTEKIAEDFAREIARRLDDARTRNRYDRLVLVAAPAFLGHLRKTLSHAAGALVAAEVSKDLASHKPEEIRKQLENVLYV